MEYMEYMEYVEYVEYMEYVEYVEYVEYMEYIYIYIERESIWNIFLHQQQLSPSALDSQP